MSSFSSCGYVLGPLDREVIGDVFEEEFEGESGSPKFFSGRFCQSNHIPEGVLPEGFRRLKIPHSFEGSINCIVGNTSLEDADIIILGDNAHSNPWQRCEIRRFFERYIHETHVFLSEQYPERVEQVRSSPCPYYRDQAQRYNLYGWDDRELQERASQLFSSAQILVEKQNALQELIKKAKVEADIPSSLEFEKELRNLDAALVQINKEIEIYGVEARNRQQIAAIETFEGKFRRTFVVTGAGHVNESYIESLKGKKIAYVDFNPCTTQETARLRRENIPEYAECSSAMDKTPNQEDLVKIRLDSGILLALPIYLLEAKSFETGDKVRISSGIDLQSYPQLQNVALDKEFEIATPPYHLHHFTQDYTTAPNPILVDLAQSVIDAFLGKISQ